ncbi:MAG TPA: hypothetical protein VNB49_10140 [Candidatus Dormibacteraeota bacterium]|nr:hypothetical protein [Candidatus Dormibacteraeota bacterium]
MKSRLLILLVCAWGASWQIAAQERIAPQAIDPKQLHIVPHDTVHRALSVFKRGVALGPLSPGLPLCVIEGETIVGACPDTGMSTTVPAVVVPVILNITQSGMGFSFDPTSGDDDCIGPGNTALGLTMNSPLFSAAPFVINGEDEGTTQYTDAFTNAQFSAIKLPGYQVLLSGTQSAPLTIPVDAGPAGNSDATVYRLGGTQCGTNPDGTNAPALIGVINVDTIDPLLQNYIAANGLNDTQFPYFVLYNAVMSVGPANNLNNCCVLGYHNALGAPGQTYGIAEFEGRNQTVFLGVSDTAAGSHEIAEWLDDPGGNNPVVPWGNIGQTSGCQGNLEVGDPLTGTLMPPVTMPNGFTYNLQELAFFSWFTRDFPSLGSGGVYSSNGTFQGFAIPCPPGGTF